MATALTIRSATSAEVCGNNRTHPGLVVSGARIPTLSSQNALVDPDTLAGGDADDLDVVLGPGAGLVDPLQQPGSGG